MLPFGFYAFFTDSAEGITLAIADLIFLLFVIFAAHKLHLFTLGFLHLQNHILSIVKFMDQNRSKLVELQDTRSFERDDYVKEQGWATMPGEENPDSKVADGCAKLIVQSGQ